jgi:hypothetical protein
VTVQGRFLYKTTGKQSRLERYFIASLDPHERTQAQWLAIIRGVLGESFELSIPEQKKYMLPEERAHIERVTRAMLEYLRANLRPYWKIF